MDVIDELITHCEAWEPWARVMGNVCAGDAAQALRSLRAELAAMDGVLCNYLKQKNDLRAELAAVREMYTEQGLTIKAQQDELAACREDAEKWRAYAARKRAVIDAGMGKIILRDAARKGEGE